MEKKISYLNRNYDDYKTALVELSKTYYPNMAFNFEDASVGSWFIDLNAAVADELSYHIDRAYQETNINSASKASSIFSMARNMGFKVPGPKGAMCEVAFRCILPPTRDNTTTSEPDWQYAPIIKKGTKVSSGAQTFELMEDLNFAEQFNRNGASDRFIQVNRDSNRRPISYTITKLAVVVAGETSVYKKYLSASDITPFMEITLPAENVMNIESIIVKDGSGFQTTPKMGEFFMPEEEMEGINATRFFEVNSLSQQERWGDVIEAGAPKTVQYGYLLGSDTASTVVPTYSVTKGEWKPVKHKFITEFTDRGYLKVIFGAGMDSGTQSFGEAQLPFSQYQINKMLRNDSLGYLPKANSTVFILYRAGGGASSNVAKGAINTISYLNVEINAERTAANTNIIAQVRSSISVESTMESVSGKDMPNTEELKYLIKYATGSQERCVTVKDYVSRVNQIPPRYGCPFRVGAAEENNKVMLYMLGVDHNGYLDPALPTTLVENVQTYLANYRMINDFVEIKSGKIINLAFVPYVIIDKEYNASDVITNIKNVVKSYMDINKHQMGDDIYVGDIAKEISKVDGVINLIKLQVYNVFGNSHSLDRTTQATVESSTCNSTGGEESDRVEIDLDASDGILYSEGDTMLEVKFFDDIIVNFKER